MWGYRWVGMGVVGGCGHVCACGVWVGVCMDVWCLWGMFVRMCGCMCARVWDLWGDVGVLEVVRCMEGEGVWGICMGGVDVGCAWEGVGVCVW